MSGYMKDAEVYVKNMHSTQPLEIPENKPTIRLGNEGDHIREYQEKLITLGYQIEANGKFDKPTFEATRQLQLDNHLKDDGIVKFSTYVALDASLTQGTTHKDPIADIENTITEKYGHITELEMQRATYDKETGTPFLSPEEQAFLGRDIVLVSAEADMQQLKNILVKADLVNESASNEAVLNAVHVIEKENNLAGDNWSGALSVIKERAIQHSFEAIPTQIQAERTGIAQLELNKQDEIETQVGVQQAEKVTVTSKIAANEAKMTALGGIEQTLKDPKFAPTNAYAAIKDDLSKADIALLTPAEQALHGKDTLNLSNKAEVSALQTVLKERG